MSHISENLNLKIPSLLDTLGLYYSTIKYRCHHKVRFVVLWRWWRL